MEANHRSYIAYSALIAIPALTCATIGYYFLGPVIYYECIQKTDYRAFGTKECRSQEQTDFNCAVGGFVFGAVLSIVCGLLPEMLARDQEKFHL